MLSLFSSVCLTQKSPRKSAAREREQQKDPKTVMVLEETDPFEYEISKDEKGKMFHATVATETELFQVKVFDTRLKEMFMKDNVIIISNYFKEKGILEITETSSVSKAGPDQKIEVPQEIKRGATASPQIKELQRQTTGTIVYGSFKLSKVITIWGEGVEVGGFGLRFAVAVVGLVWSGFCCFCQALY